VAGHLSEFLGKSLQFKKVAEGRTAADSGSSMLGPAGTGPPNLAQPPNF